MRIWAGHEITSASTVIGLEAVDAYAAGTFPADDFELASFDLNKCDVVIE